MGGLPCARPCVNHSAINLRRNLWRYLCPYLIDEELDIHTELSKEKFHLIEMGQTM